MIKGISGTRSIPISRIMPYFRDLGVKRVRNWMGGGRWSVQYMGKSSFDLAREYRKNGIQIMTLIAGHTTVPTYSVARDFFNRVADNSVGAADWYEAHNEPFYPNYFSGTPEQYVENVQRAAWDALSPRGLWVRAPVHDVNSTWMKRAVAAGILDMCNGVAQHPYHGTVASHVARVSEMHQLLGTYSQRTGRHLKISLTEWNLKGEEVPWGVRGADGRKTMTLAEKKAWAAAVVDIRSQISAWCEDYYYFGFAIRRDRTAETYNSTLGSVFANDNLTKNEPFYSMLKGL